MANTRTKNTINNISASFLSQFLNQIIIFVVRTVFIKTLGAEYLGINGLFTNILSVLSLAELGVGSAMVYSMYKPIASGDSDKIKAYMDLYKIIYRAIGSVVIAIGFVLLPFLDFFIVNRPDFINIELVYVLYILKTGSTYFFAYKQSIFRADQKVYIITMWTSVFTFIRSVAEIVFLIVTKSFVVYLILTIVANYAQNIYLAYKANKDYPYLKTKAVVKLPREEISELFKNVKAMFLNKISSVILGSTDNIILSKFLGLVVVGIYSNYSMIITVIKTTFYTIFDGITPSVGNLCAAEDSSGQKYKIFKELLLLNSWLTGFCSVCLFILFNPFIDLWVGKDYLLDSFTVAMIVLSFYIQTSTTAIGLFRSATGLFYNDRYYSVAQCIINIVVSVVCAKILGVSGIFIGTSIAMLSTTFWKQATLVYKEVLDRNPIHYFLIYGKYFIMAVGSICIIEIIDNAIDLAGIARFVFLIVLCIVVYNLIFIIWMHREEEFNDSKKRVLNILKKVKR